MLLTNLIAIKAASLVAPGRRLGWRWQLHVVIDTPCAKCPFAPPLDCFRQLWLCLLLLILLLRFRLTLHGSLVDGATVALEACRPLGGLQGGRSRRERVGSGGGGAGGGGGSLAFEQGRACTSLCAPTSPVVLPRGSQASFKVPSSSTPSTRMARSTAATRFAGLRATGRRSAICKKSEAVDSHDECEGGNWGKGTRAPGHQTNPWRLIPAVRQCRLAERALDRCRGLPCGASC